MRSDAAVSAALPAYTRPRDPTADWGATVGAVRGRELCSR